MLNQSSSKRLTDKRMTADTTAMTAIPTLAPPPKNRVSGLPSSDSKRSRSNKKSLSKRASGNGRGSDLDHVFDEAEAKVKAKKDQ